MTTAQVALSAGDAREASDARRVLRDHLVRWDCEQVEDALLVFSELVSNAIKHAGGATRIDVQYRDRMLHMAVHDRSRVVPVRRPLGDASGGFGLSIVGRLSSDWGWTSTNDGKVVWSDVACGPG